MKQHTKLFKLVIIYLRIRQYDLKNDGMGGSMFCSTCGSLVNDHDKLCCVCSQCIQRTPNNQRQAGFFSKNQKQVYEGQHFQTLSSSRLFAIGISLLLLVGFGLYGGFSSTMSFLDAISIAGLLGTFFVGFTYLNEFKVDHVSSWDGVVIDKRQTKKDKYQLTNNVRHLKQYVEYQVIIKKEEGEKHVVLHQDNDAMYHHYMIGDRVRYHINQKSYEKLNQSTRTIIFCSVCAKKHDIVDDVCQNCQSPLLK